MRPILITLSLLVVTPQLAEAVPVDGSEAANRAMIKACVQNPGAFVTLSPQITIPPSLLMLQDKSTFASLCEIAIKSGNLTTFQKQQLAKEAKLELQKEGQDSNYSATNSQENPSLIRSDLSNSKNRNATLTGRLFEDEENEKLYGEQNASETLSPEDKRKRDADMSKLASLAKRRATLEEAINCPLAGSVDYEKIYASEFQPLLIQKKYYQEEVVYYYSHLSAFGKHLANMNTVRAFFDDLDNLRETGVSNKIAYLKSSIDDNFRPMTKSDGSVEQVRSPVKNDIQVITSVINEDVFSEFESKWLPGWVDFVSKNNTLNQDIIALIPNCPPAELMRGVDPNIPNYDSIRFDRLEKCQSTPAPPPNLKSLFTDVLLKYKASLNGLNMAKSQIMTKRSKYSNQPVLFDPKRPSAIVDQTTRKCQEKLSLAEINELKARLEAVNTEYKDFVQNKVLVKVDKKEKERAAVREAAELESKKMAYATEKAKEASRFEGELETPRMAR